MIKRLFKRIMCIHEKKKRIAIRKWSPTSKYKNEGDNVFTREVIEKCIECEKLIKRVEHRSDSEFYYK